MKVKISGLFFLCLLSLCLSANAQKRSTIQIHTGGYYIPGYGSLNSDYSYLVASKGLQANYKKIFALQGIKYQYRFFKSLSVFVGYSLTNNQSKFYNFGNRVSSPLV